MRLQRLSKISSLFILCFILFLPCIVAADPLDNWHVRSTNHGLQGVAYGNGLFVAVGKGKILTSSDGVMWTEKTSGIISEISFTGVAYGNGTFVAVGDNGSIFTSSDGVNWIPSTGTITSTAFDAAFSNYPPIRELKSIFFWKRQVHRHRPRI